MVKISKSSGKKTTTKVKKVKTAEQNIAEAKIAKKKWELLEEKRRADRWSRINEADEKEMKMNDMLKRLGLGRM